MFDQLLRLLSSNHHTPFGAHIGWDTPLIVIMVVANLSIALAYFAIPVALMYLVKHRRDLAFPWIFKLFGAFITMCGLTCLVKIWTIYQPVYWIEACVDSATAVLSVVTAFLLWPLVPQALSLRSSSELTALNEQLKQVNEDLTTARDEAMEASNLKSAFVANISHELRTPLSSVLGSTELLMKTRLDGEQKHLTQMINASGRALLSIVNDILDLSKIEAGKLQINTQPFNLPDLISDCCKALAETADRRGVNITSDVDIRIQDNLRGDPHRIRQILLNIMDNAIKFTPEGSVKVRAMVELENADSVSVKFFVTDTGVGIAPEEQRHLFVPFTQVDGSTTRKHGGTGLGLAICKRLVELLGGDIGVVSSKGKGATFWFVVPFCRDTAKAGVVTPAASFSRLLADRDLLVLVVEDNPIIQQLALKQLENMGMVAKAVGDGQTAVDELSQTRYDMILMDCHLPMMDGFEATRVIRQLENATGRHTPIVAMTAGAMQGDEERCLAAGMDDYMSKPYTLKQLKEMLQKWMSKPSAVQDPVVDIDAAAVSARKEPAVEVEVGRTEQGTSGDGNGNGNGNGHGANGKTASKPMDIEWLSTMMNAQERLELLGTFTATTEKLLAELRAAVAGGDWKLVAGLAHSLKGQFALYQAPEMRRLAAHLETATKTQDAKEAVSTCRQLVEAFDELKKYLAGVI